MLANAIASTLEKKILLISFPSLGVMNADENFRFVFREAKARHTHLSAQPSIHLATHTQPPSTQPLPLEHHARL